MSDEDKAVLRKIVERADGHWILPHDGLPIGSKVMTLSAEELNTLRRLSR